MNDTKENILVVEDDMPRSAEESLEIKAKGGDDFDTTGSVYAVLEKVVNNIMADEAIKEKETNERK